eukprot:143439_1
MNEHAHQISLSEYNMVNIISVINSHVNYTIITMTHGYEKNREFAIWSRLLRETIEIYGEWISLSKNQFYTCIGNSKIMFNNFSASINMPTSTTNDISIIGLYSNNDGYVLELSENKNNAIGLFIKYFNGSFFSNYSYEQE